MSKGRGTRVRSPIHVHLFSFLSFFLSSSDQTPIPTLPFTHHTHTFHFRFAEAVSLRVSMSIPPARNVGATAVIDGNDVCQPYPAVVKTAAGPCCQYCTHNGTPPVPEFQLDSRRPPNKRAPIPCVMAAGASRTDSETHPGSTRAIVYCPGFIPVNEGIGQESIAGISINVRDLQELSARGAVPRRESEAEIPLFAKGMISLDLSWVLSNNGRLIVIRCVSHGNRYPRNSTTPTTLPFHATFRHGQSPIRPYWTLSLDSTS